MLRGAIGLVAGPEVIRRSGPHITEHGPAQRLPAAFRQPPPKLGICAPVIRNAGIGRRHSPRSASRCPSATSSKSSHAVFMPPSPSARGRCAFAWLPGWWRNFPFEAHTFAAHAFDWVEEFNPPRLEAPAG